MGVRVMMSQGVVGVNPVLQYYPNATHWAEEDGRLRVWSRPVVGPQNNISTLFAEFAPLSWMFVEQYEDGSDATQ